MELNNGHAKDAENEPAPNEPLFDKANTSTMQDYEEKANQSKSKCEVCICTKKRRLIITIILVMLFIYAVGLAIGLAVGLSGGEKKLEKNDTIEDKIPTGAVVSDHEACSDIGRDILERQGTAVDAAIATLICNGVRTPHSMGIGGGMFMVIYDKSAKKSIYIDGREMAPHSITQHIYSNLTKHNVRAHMIAIPGELKAYKYAHGEYGRLPWAELFKPTIQMLRDGFPLSESTGNTLAFITDRMKLKLTSFPTICNIFCSDKAAGTPLKAGETLHWPHLADTLQGIADQGPDYIYDSKLTQTLVDEIQDAGGVLDLQDFILNYKLHSGSPLEVGLGNYTMYTMPGATGGPMVALMMNILKHDPWSTLDMGNLTDKSIVYHALIEAMKFASADKYFLEDPTFNDQVNETIAKMVSEEYAGILRHKIRDKAQPSSFYTKAVRDYTDIGGTSHVSVLSPYGDAVSVTSTINGYFGSGFASNSTGIIWNNEMQDFDTLGNATFNRIEPLKRPRSAMAPVILVDRQGNVRLVTGAAGGGRIPSAIAQVLTNMFLLGTSLEEAVSQDRVHADVGKNTVDIEKTMPEDLVEKLQEMGHNVVPNDGIVFSVVESIEVMGNGSIKGYADPRKQPGKASYVYKTVKKGMKS
ncbi:glutathione hydrolase 1 proenzyme-like isoform X3 [Dreissena polymorpha]|uniref:glutathione hydrolase 1 proenzyme-like isoform X3 n=1 Tax=Dreissena polymorpha TaxID=45954 RepID=UPI002263BD1A|nr:glutathione hydrolase 1 proenzyme-like isoform X3 [Dreissena polymorpha]XP_052270408.1 glutathione hydrolase 1 proenzyme-like isoform X3 [Dreissena polymorpha]